MNVLAKAKCPKCLETGMWDEINKSLCINCGAVSTLDFSKMTAYLWYDAEGAVRQAYVVQGTDDPVELEHVLDERPTEDEEGNEVDPEDTVPYLISRGYVVTKLSSILEEDGYDAPMAHELGEEY